AKRADARAGALTNDVREKIRFIMVLVSLRFGFIFYNVVGQTILSPRYAYYIACPIIKNNE
ncbi:MAG: hypothetical protein L7V29_03980, partial [Alphaproteobacteria bacterium]|nr:hypothetical protein [Alphaproteobacteria bacterium]